MNPANLPFSLPPPQPAPPPSAPLSDELLDSYTLVVEVAGKTQVFRCTAQQVSATQSTPVALKQRDWATTLDPFLQTAVKKTGDALPDDFNPEKDTQIIHLEHYQIGYGDPASPTFLASIDAPENTLDPIKNLLIAAKPLPPSSPPASPSPPPSSASSLPPIERELNDLNTPLSPSTYFLGFQLLKNTHPKAHFFPATDSLSLSPPPWNGPIFVPLKVNGHTVLLYRRLTSVLGRNQWRYYDPSGKAPFKDAAAQIAKILPATAGVDISLRPSKPHFHTRIQVHSDAPSKWPEQELAEILRKIDDTLKGAVPLEEPAKLNSQTERGALAHFRRDLARRIRDYTPPSPSSSP